MEFFNFGLEQKLDRHYGVEFHSESNGDGFNLPKSQLNLPKCPLGTPKNEIFQLWTSTKVIPTFLCRISYFMANKIMRVHTVKSIVIKAL